MTVTTQVKNGVDVQRLTTFIDEVRREPWKGRVSFCVKSEWTGGFKAKHTVSSYAVGDEPENHVVDHTIMSDEPRGILGSDAGVSPAELLLTALASCLSVGYAANAAAMGIELHELRFEVTGHGDLQGFMNLNDVRPGLSEIAVRTYIRSDAPQEKLQELHDYVNAHSPIWDTLRSPVAVKSELKVE